VTCTRTVLLGAVLLVVAVLPARFEAAGRPVGLTARDGTALTGQVFDASSRPSPGIVLVHMLGKSKDEWTWMAERLQDAGATVLTVDLRGHGGSGGSAGALPAMVNDVAAAIDWLASRPNIRPGSLAVVGSSLGANLAALAAADRATVRAVALVSPSLDYRGVRLDVAAMKRLGARPVWMAASTEDPYALRTIRELILSGTPREQALSPVRGHGTSLLTADADLSRGLMDWLRRTLVF
jgi:pimeloyl-ACP methyl ester carboxylesterase